MSSLESIEAPPSRVYIYEIPFDRVHIVSLGNELSLAWLTCAPRGRRNWAAADWCALIAVVRKD